uniref:Uncharacterized protein n=1 Tax=Arundo donax TaxID=35708 RepID=A0A0A9BFN5_ARUDO
MKAASGLVVVAIILNKVPHRFQEAHVVRSARLLFPKSLPLMSRLLDRADEPLSMQRWRLLNGLWCGASFVPLNVVHEARTDLA